MPVLLESVQLINETPAAILIEFDDGGTDVEANRYWIPLSVVESSDLDEVGDIGDVEIRSWFYDKEDGLSDANERAQNYRGDVTF